MLDTVVISGEMFVVVWAGVSVFSVLYGHQCTSGVCVHISGEDLVWYVCDMLYAVLYVRLICFLVRGCAVSMRSIHVCNSDMFSIVNLYLHHVKLCVVCIYSRGMPVLVNVMLCLMNVMSPPPNLCNLVCSV